MIELIVSFLKPILLPIIAELVGDIFKRQTIDPRYVEKLMEASYKYKEAKTSEEKRQARIDLIKLTRK